MRCLLPIVLALSSGSLASGNDEIPRRVLVDDSEYVGRHEGLFEDVYYLWLHVEELERERAEWRLGFDDAQDATLLAMETFAEFAQDEDDESFLAALIQPGAAPAHGLRDGQRIPPEEFANVCRTASFDPSEDAVLDQPPVRFARHVEQALGAVLGRVTRIEHGFSGPVPSLLLELDVEDTLIPSDYSPHAYLVVATSGYVHQETVFCSWPGMKGWLPTVGERLIAMPVTGPWEKDGEIIPIFDPVEIFLVGEPDSAGVSAVTPLLERTSVPRTLLDFRRRLWDIHDGIGHEAADTRVPRQ